MNYTTRFNPTLNGFLHLGHLYMALVNRAEGNRFIVRLDDTQRYWNWLYSTAELYDFHSEMVCDLEYFGVQVDSWSSQADLMPECERLIDEIGWPIKDQPFVPVGVSEVQGWKSPVYPFTERLTAEKVIFDTLQGVNLVVRGIDLLSEDNLYRYFVDKLELSQPRMVYIPRLEFEGDVISKTEGGYKLHDYRQLGYNPKTEVIELLAMDCLIDPYGAWKAENIKPRPILGEWAKRLLCHS